MMQMITTLSGQPLSRFVFGTMQFGGKADAQASQTMFEACRAAGINHFDTAHVYTEGRSESLLGQFVQAQRDDIFVATKAGYTGGAGAQTIETQFDLSRKRLGLDQVDLLYLHRFDPGTHLRETMACFAQLRDAGKLRYVGLSNFAAWQVMKAVAIGAEFDLRVHMLQPMYNLVKRQAEVEILPMCADQAIRVAAYSPLGGGLLTGKYAKGGEGRLTQDARYGARYGVPDMHQAARSLDDLATREGVAPATLAVAWLAQGGAQPSAARAVVNPIISASHPDQLGPSLDAMGMTVSAELMADLSRLMPAPPPATDRIEEQKND